MDKIRNIIELKYAWVGEYRISLDWAEMAKNEGTSDINIAIYPTNQVFKKAA